MDLTEASRNLLAFRIKGPHFGCNGRQPYGSNRIFHFQRENIQNLWTLGLRAGSVKRVALKGLANLQVTDEDCEYMVESVLSL